jgi:hypothetical protein
LPSFGGLRDRIFRLGSRYFTRTWHAEAVLSDGTRLRCLFAGSRRVAEYLLAAPCFAAAALDRLPIRTGLLAHLGERGGEPLDLCFAALERGHALPAGSWQYRQPEFVRQEIAIGPAAAPNRRLSAKLKETARRIRRAGFVAEVSHDAADLAFFYERMFVPHTRQQFGTYADIEPLGAMAPFFHRGFLVFASRGGVRLTGSLCHVDDGVFVYRRMGILDGDRAQLASGAQAAIYHFFVTLAEEMGCRAIDLMNSRPFPNDGVFRYKRDWGASVHPEPGAERDIYHFHLGDPGAIARFYRENPAIVATEEGLEVLTGVGDDDGLDAVALRRRLCSPGIGGLRVLRGAGGPLRFACGEASEAGGDEG